jgi:peptidoglycan hydrolase-like protein with peptidoglycan-binding domain
VVARIWIPSPNYSASRSRNQLLVVHTSEGAQTFASLGNFLGQSSSGVSYHVGFDDTSSTQIGEYVKPPGKCWAAFESNDWGEHGCCCTPSGASYGWSRDTWMAKVNMLAACAAWLAEESARYGIPLVKITGADIDAGRPGVCGHADVSASSAQGDHGDPGPNFPWDHVLALAGGAPGAPPVAPPATGGGLGPPFPGTLLVNYLEGHGTATWQARMAERGWPIAVDDAYGNESEGICRQFQAEKGLAIDGIVGPDTWAAAWTLPVT